MNRNALGWSSAILNMALNIAIIVLPLRPLSKLAMEWRRKAQVMLMFMVGIFITIVSIIRLQPLVHFADTTNPTWDYRQMGVWSQIEVHVGNVCTCMPAVYSLMKKIWPTCLDTNKERTYTSDNSKQQISSRAPKKSRGDTEDEDFVRLEEFDGGKTSVRVTAGV
ncbi:hypothetical protein BCR34DRAFT_227429 [Clohesyomyces aquaticus]|uniref:Rhodopsin domain-containing protein n=1 Tax=Clohesyomyces aquaticus TaxID=1231657 RepID=A0A1Y1ZW96_9PLEO|nr:hypothetical protein BCR34DRAFT_227429 [Clohesyomyces aquaticus]